MKTTMTKATLKGKLNTSIDVLLGTVKSIGDQVDFHNITKMVPTGTDYTRFLYACIEFCNGNGGAKEYRVEDVIQSADGTQIVVCPAK